MEKQTTVPVYFSVARKLNFGESVFLCGGHPVLGNWDPSNAIPLKCENEQFWSIRVNLPVPGKYEYKYFVAPTDNKGLCQFDEGNNKEIILTPKSLETCIKVMSFNIRGFNKHDGKNHWDKRKPHVINLIKYLDCSIFGLQEATAIQQEYISNELSSIYNWVYVARDGAKGEGTPIYFKKTDWNAVDTKTFWLSDTPEIFASKTFGNSVPRICTWVKLSKKETNKSIIVMNTHYDHIDSKIRQKSSQLMIQQIESLRKNCENLILMGDFNAISCSPEIQIIREKSNLIDTYVNYCGCEKESGNCATFHDWTGCILGERIDYIFITPNLKCDEFCICRDTIGTDKKLYPSDHFPIISCINII